MTGPSSSGGFTADVVLLALAVVVAIALSVGFGSTTGLVWPFVSTLAFLYLLYRLVLAGERIATAQERRADAAEVGTDLESPDHDATGESTLDEFGLEDDPDSATDSGGD